MRAFDKEFPRPQFVREAWENLNGAWDFAFDNGNAGEKEKWFESFPTQKTIQVPYTYETEMSGIQETAFTPVVWYRRKFTRQPGKRTLLHFEGSDFITKVWVNGQCAGSHTGGYTRFTFDITDLLVEGDNTLTVRVEDSDDTMQPRGKQRWKKENFGCWYVQTTGIWKTVWLEYVAQTRLDTIKITPLLTELCAEIEWQVEAPAYGKDLTLKADITFNGQYVNGFTAPVCQKRGKTRVHMASTDVYEWSIKTWTPEEPNLYDIDFTLYENGTEVDKVASYFGMREIRIENGVVLLNGKPLYQKLILDQGYWPESGFTPPSYEALEKDVDSTLAMGFNGARKHQKVEDDRYYAMCDRKGLLSWCEMPSPYQFGDDEVQWFAEEWVRIVRQHYNHPAVIVWTPFNESWGIAQVKTDKMQQDFTVGIYHLTKALDKFRPVISNDGWEHTTSDIITLHDYDQNGEVLLDRYGCHMGEILENEIFHNTSKSAFANGFAYEGQPILISEYGGAAFQNAKGALWGYGKNVENEADFLARMDALTTAVKEMENVCGYCYTQVTDVEQEVNGLMTTDRKYKADLAQMKEINDRAVGTLRLEYMNSEFEK